MSLGLLFPGQGSQHPGMFDQWLGRSTSLLGVIRMTVSEDPERLPDHALGRNEVAQPIIVGHQVGSFEALRPVLPDDAIMLGYSVGEISACAAVGALPTEDAVLRAAERAVIMDRVSPAGSGMAAIKGLYLRQVERIVAGSGAEIAIENGPDHFVLGGPEQALEDCVRAFERAGARTVKRLQVSVSSHTSQLEAGAVPFRACLEARLTSEPAFRMISGMSAKPLSTRADIIDSLARQLHTPLRFAVALDAAREAGVTAFLEIGPGHALSQIVGEIMPDVPVRALEAFRSVEGVSAWIQRTV